MLLSSISITIFEVIFDQQFRISSRGVVVVPHFSSKTRNLLMWWTQISPLDSHLISLQFLTFWECPNLTSLPQGIRSLTSLTELKITDCPLLRQRCKRQIGEDWSIVAHVPRVILDYENQQEETIFSGTHLSYNPKLKIKYFFWWDNYRMNSFFS